jgi:hypothetical protein
VTLIRLVDDELRRAQRPRSLQFIDRAIADADFRKRLSERCAGQREGFRMSPEGVDVLFGVRSTSANA